MRLIAIDQCRTIWSSPRFGGGSVASPSPGTLRVGPRVRRLNTACLPLPGR